MELVRVEEGTAWMLAENMGLLALTMAWVVRTGMADLEARTADLEVNIVGGGVRTKMVEGGMGKKLVRVGVGKKLVRVGVLVGVSVGMMVVRTMRTWVVVQNSTAAAQVVVRVVMKGSRLGPVVVMIKVPVLKKVLKDRKVVVSMKEETRTSETSLRTWEVGSESMLNFLRVVNGAWECSIEIFRGSKMSRTALSTVVIPVRWSRYYLISLAKGFEFVAGMLPSVESARPVLAIFASW